MYNQESKLAEAHMSKTGNYNPEATYNKFSIEKLHCINKFHSISYFKSTTNTTID